jgi:lipoate-protein ligase A
VVESLRIVDFGRSSPLRSQTLWHAIAYGVSASERVTLSFTRPAAPYVCLGYHRGIEEVDRDYCLENGLPLLRRMVGGGPVYLDSDQLFFQICLPVRTMPAARCQALRVLLEPVVTAFRAVGVPAVLDDELEICAGDRKICGHGAAQIEDAVVVCGNLIERFDHERAARVLALADPSQRDQTLTLMRRFVAPTPLDPAAFQAAMVDAYAAALGLDPEVGGLTGTERTALASLDERFTSDTWLAGPVRPGMARACGPSVRQVKVRAGVWTLGASYDGARVAASVVRGTIDLVRLHDRALNGSRDRAEQALIGIPLQSVALVLAGFGDPGRRLALAFATADPARL